MELTNGCLEVFSVIVLLIIFISMYHGKAIDAAQKRLSAILICHILVLLLDAAHWFLYQRTDLNALMAVLSFAPTILALIENAFFACFTIDFLSQKGLISLKTKMLVFVPFGLAIITWACFVFINGINNATNIQTEYDVLQYGWIYWLGHLLWSSVCVMGIVFILRCRNGLNKNELLPLISYCVFPLIALLLRPFWDGPLIFLGTSLSLVWIYSVIHKEQRQRLAEREARLAQSRIAVLLSQIQPHFIYNTLTSICGLCDESPLEAKKTTAEFADYLRHNLESLTQTAPIPFEEELQHTKIYLDIEKKRFEDRLDVVYNIMVQNFAIPSLTVQPLVENAVKHGIMKSKSGGRITLSTIEKDLCYEVSIKDNGVGFDTSYIKEDNNLHIGIQNAKDRLWAMCKGTLTVESEIGIGTTAFISIPKGEEKYEYYCGG